MTNREPTPADRVLVAIDISKLRNDVLIELPGSVRRKRLIVLNTKTEHDRFVGLLGDFGRPVIAGFEATGNYHRPLAHRLLEAGLELRLVSSVALARTREALHNGWDKNDPKDAQVILHMLRIGATQTYCDPIGAGINDIQELSKTHEVVSKAKTELWHRLLTHYLPLYFPEIERFAGNSRSDWFLAFLEQFPTPASITPAQRKVFHQPPGISSAEGVEGQAVGRYLRDREFLDRPADRDRRPAIAMFRLVVAEGRSLIRQRDVIEARPTSFCARARTTIACAGAGIGPINR